MPANLMRQKDNTITVQFTIELTGQMLTDEQALQQSLNEAGQVAMAPMIKQFDTSGEPIRVNEVKHTVKNYAPEIYETPYGPVQDYAKKLSDFVGSVAQCYETEWKYDLLCCDAGVWQREVQR